MFSADYACAVGPASGSEGGSVGNKNSFEDTGGTLRRSSYFAVAAKDGVLNVYDDGFFHVSMLAGKAIAAVLQYRRLPAAF